ncbi:MAG: hypothetical protein J7L72_01260 [Candidatus Aminicenantes bacterium]|nr:hypothetical protein [Candidatus Aminicenantes bacterium]
MSKSKQNPPKVGQKLLSYLARYELEHSISGHCCEEYKEHVKEKGKLRALLWYWGQVLYALASYSKLSFSTGSRTRSSFPDIRMDAKPHKA